MLPCAPSTARTAAVTEASSSTSIGSTVIGSDSRRARSARAGARSGLRMPANTSWPTRASASAVANPMPVLVPVMSATAMRDVSLVAPRAP